MTTNNHPAQGPVSLDRLHQISEILSKAAAQSDGGNLGYAMVDAVKVIDGAIAAFGAEPVLYAMQGVNLDTDAVSTCKSVVDGWVDEWNQERKPGVPEYKTVPLYIIPPAPVVPDEMTPVVEGGEIIAYERHGERFSTIVGATWNTCCRAAMLNHCGDVTDKAEHVNHPSSNESSADAAVGVEIKQPSSNSGWIPVSERMPEDGENVVIVDSDHGCFYGGAAVLYRAPNFYLMDGLEAHNYDGGALVNIDFEATHWMPLPAAPQQEVKS